MNIEKVLKVTSIISIQFLKVSFGENNEKGWKGLRNLSFRVKKIIQKDEQTSYKEVADKLVREMRSDNKRKTNNT